MNLSLENKQKLDKIGRIVFPLILILYPLRHIRVGAEWWDTGYNYANFTYMERMDDMWLFSTYLGNVVGNFLTKLPFGDCMLGLNLYTGLVVSLLALFGYYFFVREVKIPAGIVFIGEFLAISLCWCPTALLYNYLTYVLLGVGVVFLYFALMRERRSRLFFVLAGICLGINVFVRFSNLANMALIVAVWAMGVIRKDKTVKVLQQTLWCICGYLIGLGAVFALICIRYGADAYIQGVLRLLDMPAEASSYTMRSMIEYQLRNYLQNMIWLGYLLAFVLAGMLVYQILPKSWNKIKNMGYVICVFGGFYVLRNMNMFNMKYSTKMSAFQWAVMLLTATLAAGLIVIFKNGFSDREKLLSGLGIIVIVITPLGSNNHLYSSINNLFFVLPFTLWLLYRFWCYLPGQWEVCKKKISSYPIKAMYASIFAMILLQCTLFGWFYVFHEGDGGENLHTGIERNTILKGILTDERRAVVLEEISDYVRENGLSGQEVILYGQIPAMSYYLEMPFAISAWPDLASYHYSVMEEDLRLVQQKAEQTGSALPVLLLEKRQGTYLLHGRQGLESLGTVSEAEIERIVEDKKLTLLSEMIEQYDYEVTFENDKFVLFLAETEGE